MQVKKDGFTFQCEHDFAIITECTETSPVMIIPSNVNGKVVIGIAEDVFHHRDSILKVYLPDTIRRIGKRAFNNCSMLEEIKMYKSKEEPNTIIKQMLINSFAFADCRKLQKVNLDKKELIIDQLSFVRCYKLTDFDVLIKEIKHLGFDNCPEIQKLTFAQNAIIENTALDSLKTLRKIFFNGNATVQDAALKILLDHQIQIHCEKTSNLIELSYLGYDVRMWR